jgi:chemotaxis protein CheC
MILTEQQNDSLSELINIAFGRTAYSLSELTGQRVVLDNPRIKMLPTGELFSSLGKVMSGEVATVHQMFSGPVSGDALLLLDYDGAVLLASLLTDETIQANRLDMSAREVLTEVGNILLNACLGMFGNLLHVHVSFSLPRLHLDLLDGLLKTIIAGKEELRYAMVITTAFRLRESAVSGYLIIILGVTSLDRLIQAVETWEKRQTNEESQGSNQSDK